MPDARVLVVEDMADIRMALEAALEDEGHEVRSAADGETALRAFYEFRPDLVLLDMVLPGLHGLDVCEQLRMMSTVPVIVFSGVGNEREKIEALNRGADDYVVKGVGMNELMARVAAALRRARVPATATIPDTYSDSEVQVDFRRRSVRVRGETVDLTPTEFDLLATLVNGNGRPLRAEELLREVWGVGYETGDLVKWHIAHLRAKIEQDRENPKLVVTRRGFGYAYLAPAA
jgi:two-component system KDP operon response regulator KdpE